MHPKVFDLFACNFHITFPRAITTHKPFTGARLIGFLDNFYPLAKEKILLKGIERISESHAMCSGLRSPMK
jgi:hypothetical protein